MLPLTTARELLNDPNLTDAEVEHLRDACHVYVNLIIEAVQEATLAAPDDQLYCEDDH